MAAPGPTVPGVRRLMTARLETLRAGGGRDSGHDASGQGGGNGSIVLLLSLFLLLLVFFIVLNGQTVQHAAKARAVIHSIEQRFTIDPRLKEGMDPVASRSGTVFAAERLAQVGDLFATAVAVVKVTEVRPGRLLEVRIPEDALFRPGTAEILPQRQGLIDRVAESLRQTRTGERIELDALLAISPDRPSQPPGPVERAGALARALVAVGAPPAAVTVGIERGLPGTARLLFSIRLAEEPPGRGSGSSSGGGRR